MAHTQKLNGQEPVYHAMIKRDLQQIDDVRYHFEVDNALQKSRMDAAIGEIMAHLRKELQNYDLEINIDITNDDTEEVKHLTGKDKFEKMARKNSNLFDFRNRFNLDIDY